MVFVLSKNKKPLAPTSNAKARILLKRGHAVIDKVYPFVIRLKENKEALHGFEIKLDPGASVTGIAIVDTKKALFFFELVHRGKVIKKALLSRRAVRASRRTRNTRYRQARFSNRTRKEGWLAPSVKSRADNVVNFVKKYCRFIPLSKATIERVSFDTSTMTSGKKLYGTEYQQGALYQTKQREYIFQKHNRTCVYCNGASNDYRLEIEHIVSKANGGSDSTHNLTLSCRTCNDKKGNLTLKAFEKLMKNDYSHLAPNITPKEAAIIQSARNYTIEEVAKLMDVNTGEGWETSFNRIERDLPKEHYFDALCVGSKSDYAIATSQVLIVKAQGRGSRQMCRVDRYGFPRTKAKEHKSINGFQTGDIVKAVVPKGVKQGKYFGRVAVRNSGSFNITTKDKTVQGIFSRDCKLIQRGDGYAYQRKTISFPCLQARVFMGVIR